MPFEKVKDYLKQYHMEDRLHEFLVSSATVELAAQALQVEPARIAKSLSFHEGDGCVIIVAAGDAKVDNAKFKAEFQTKAKMLAPDEVEPLTGYQIGGVCPFGKRPARPTDGSGRQCARAWISCGDIRCSSPWPPASASGKCAIRPRWWCRSYSRRVCWGCPSAAWD